MAKVRGAPAIAVVGALSLAVELHARKFGSARELCAYVRERLDRLVAARPTAVNMADARAKLTALLDGWTTGDHAKPVDEIQAR